MKQVDELIRGEMSAVKSIDAIISKIKDANEVRELSTMRSDHANAVELLKAHASADVIDDSQSAGPWGAFASAFTSGASLFGDKAALGALKIGEEHGRQEYKEFLEEGSIDSELRNLIEQQLMPQQERHLKTISHYIQ